MNKKLILLFIFSSLSYEVLSYSSPSIGQLQVPPRSIVGVDGSVISFPRNNTIRYRGQEAELFTLSDALKAFFGDNNSVVESLDFSAISLMLQKKWWKTPDEDSMKMNRMRKFYCKNWKYRDDSKSLNKKDCYNLENTYIKNSVSLKDTVNSYLKKKPKYSIKESKSIAKRILNQKFGHESDERKKNRLLDYNSRYYQDFPSDVLFSSVFQQNAMIYGDSIIVIKEDVNRSLDLGYYNGIINSKWSKFSDAGEFITPGYIDNDEVIGLHIRKRAEYPDKVRNRVRIDEYRVQKHEPIEYAFYKVEYKSKTYVYVFDGYRGRKTNHCLTVTNGNFNHCKWAIPSSQHGDRMVLSTDQALSKKLSYVPNLIGILALKKVNETSSVPKKLFKKFQYFSKKTLDMNLKNSIGVGAESPQKTIKDFRMNINGEIYNLEFHKPSM